VEPIVIEDSLISLPATISKILIWGFILGAGFFLLKKGIKLMPPEARVKNKMLGLFFWIKVASWILFSFYAIDLIFHDYPLVSRLCAISLVFILIGISWPIIRDFIYGVIIKLENAYPLNGNIKLESIEGKVKKLGARSIEIETEKGESISIPYGLMNQKISVQSNVSDSTKSSSFVITLPKTKTYKTYENQIITELINNHWSSLKKEPKVKLLKETDASYELQVTAYAMTEYYHSSIENHIKTILSEGPNTQPQDVN
jgi:small-conductance mechanosensitive channel